MARKGRACRCHGRCQVEQLNAVLGRGDGAAVADCAANRRAADDDAATRGVDRSAVDHVALDDGESGGSGIVGGEDLDAESGIDRTGIEDVAGDGLAAGNIPGGSVGKYINSGGDVGSAGRNTRIGINRIDDAEVLDRAVDHAAVDDLDGAGRVAADRAILPIDDIAVDRRFIHLDRRQGIKGVSRDRAVIGDAADSGSEYRYAAAAHGNAGDVDRGARRVDDRAGDVRRSGDDDSIEGGIDGSTIDDAAIYSAAPVDHDAVKGGGDRAAARIADVAADGAAAVDQNAGARGDAALIDDAAAD